MVVRGCRCATAIQRRGDRSCAAQPAGGDTGGSVPETGSTQVTAGPPNRDSLRIAELNGSGVRRLHSAVTPCAWQRFDLGLVQFDDEQSPLTVGQPRGDQCV